MRKAITVMVILLAIIVLSVSSANATCKMADYGKITWIAAGDGNPLWYGVFVLQNGTTNRYWHGMVLSTDPLLGLLVSAMAGGTSVLLTGNASTCPSPSPTAAGTLVRVGNIISSSFRK